MLKVLRSHFIRTRVLRNHSPSLLHSEAHADGGRVLARAPRVGEPLAYAARNQADADEVVSAFGNYHVGVALRRLYELHVHRPHGREILLDDRLGGAPALGHVAAQASYEAYVV